MAQPAAVSGDQVDAVCSPHPLPDPATGAPQPTAALVAHANAATVLIGG